MSKEYHYTSVEVGKELLELGVKPDVGEFFYRYVEDTKSYETYWNYFLNDDERHLPSLSIGEVNDVLDSISAQISSRFDTNQRIIKLFEMELSDGFITKQIIEKALNYEH